MSAHLFFSYYGEYSKKQQKGNKMHKKVERNTANSQVGGKSWNPWKRDPSDGKPQNNTYWPTQPTRDHLYPTHPFSVD